MKENTATRRCPAEISALLDAEQKQRSVSGATLYTTVEPCTFFGRTPPCTSAIIRNGIKRVVIGIRDPHPKVQGKGTHQLRISGIVVKENVCQSLVEDYLLECFRDIRNNRSVCTRTIFASLLFEGVEQSGEEAAFAFPGAVATLTAAQSGVEQVPEGVTEHVEGVDDNRQAKTRPERQPWRYLHVETSFPSWGTRRADRIPGSSEKPQP